MFVAALGCVSECSTSTSSNAWKRRKRTSRPTPKRARTPSRWTGPSSRAACMARARLCCGARSSIRLARRHRHIAAHPQPTRAMRACMAASAQCGGASWRRWAVHAHRHSGPTRTGLIAFAAATLPESWSTLEYLNHSLRISCLLDPLRSQHALPCSHRSRSRANRRAGFCAAGVCR